MTAHGCLIRRGLLVLALLLACALPQAAAASRVAVGEAIGSAVDVFYQVRGVQGALQARSNVPIVIMEPRRSGADISLMRESADPAAGVVAAIGSVAYATDPDDGTAFVPQETVPVDMDAGVRLLAGTVFVAGEVIFFHLNDEGRNHLPDAIETIDVELAGAGGDREVFRLSADGPDSSDFYGYALAVPETEAVPGDGRIAVEANGTVTVSYDDPFDSSDAVVSVVVVEPHVKIYDTVTGNPIDGATVTVLRAADDAPATALGVDGYSALAGLVTSGIDATDTRGRIYRAEPGEVRLPYLPPGRYRLSIDTPSTHVFPADTPQAMLDVLPGGPYRSAAGSRGEVFDHVLAGPLRFDVPLDRRGVLVLRKTVSTDRAAQGDFVTFRLTLENDDDRTAVNATIADTLPPGFRFEPGTLRLDDIIVPDPAVGDDGGSLTISVGDLAKGESRVAHYVARVGAGARIGRAESSAIARAQGGFRSNRAEAVLSVIDGLGAASATIVGRVVIGPCGAPGEGVRGARLFLEDGRHVVTDADGRFHIDGLSTGAHVLRLDEHALGDGLVPLACAGDVRPGETARKRQLRVRGGQLRRVIFRLEQRETETVAAVDTATIADDTVYDEEFLGTLEKELQIVFPAEGESMDDPSLRIGVAYPMGSRVGLRIAGEPVSGLSSEKTIANRKARMAMKRWRGIDLPDGETIVEAFLTDANGVETETVVRRIHYVTEPAKAEFLPDLSTLIADGKTAPRIAVRVTDKAGRALHSGRRVPVALDPPYQAKGSQARFENNPLATTDATLSALTIESDGIGYLELMPTTRSGEALLRLQLTEREVTVRPFLVAAARPWVLVALAEGTAGYNTVSGNMSAVDRAGLDDGLFVDGRASFFAKGSIRGDWLLTLAYDSDKDWGTRDAPFADTIDPNAYYPVYGDASEQGSSAQSGYPLYVRLERGQFHATFGDFETGLDRTDLGAYQRSLSGLKTVYEGDRFSVIAFAADADQTFRRREIPVTAGIGPYDLGDRDILRNTERVRLVTRNRDLLSEVLTERVLAPFIDYTFDYTEGTVQLRTPPGATDEAFNPHILVVDYELPAPDMDALTAGGRAAVRLLDDAVEVGGTVLREAGASAGESGELAAVDTTVKIGTDIEIEAEAAMSRAESEGIERSGTAWRAEGRYRNDDWRGKVYIRQADSDFGIAQQSAADAGRRIIGAEMSASVKPFAGDDDETATALDLSATLTREEELVSGARRDSAEAMVSRPFTLAGIGDGEAAFGYRGMRDRLADGSGREIHRLVARGSIAVLENRARLTVEREQAIASTGTGWEPDSVTVSLDAALTEKIRARAAVQAFDGEDADAANLHVGLVAEPWSGATVHFGLGGLRDAMGDGAEQVAATVGVGQSVSLTEKLSATFSVDHVQPFGTEVSPAATLFSTTQPSEAVTNASAGLAYGAEGWSASVRLDLRRTETADSGRLFLGAVGDLTEAFTLSLGGDAGITQPFAGTGQRNASARIGIAYRPDDGMLTALHRLEADFTKSGTWETKVINTLAAEARVHERLTLAGTHAVRYLDTEIDDRRFSSVTQFGGLDAYFGVTDHWSLGLHGNALMTGWGEETAYGYGASVGYSPRAGMTLRAGYNVEGFSDDDFSAANATARGPFLSIVLDFDEDDVAGAFGALRGIGR